MGNHNKKHLVPAEEFVGAVMTYKSVAQVAEHLNLKEVSVRARIKKFRKLGVKLPSYEKRGRSINVSHLNQIIRSYK
jgi:biotin operon repressor